MKLVARLSFLAAFVLNILVTSLAAGYPLKVVDPFYTDINFYANQVFWLALVFTVVGGILRTSKSKAD